MAVNRTPWARFDSSRRLRRWSLAAALLVLAVALSLADQRGWLLYDGNDLTRYDGQWFEVTGIVDGDTLDIAARDGDKPTTRVRLWGIDTPETAKDWLNEPADPLADEAMELLRQLCANQRVRLALQSHQPRDRYRRLLAYIELEDGRIANEVILAAGLAEAQDGWDHVHIGRYELLERQAKHDEVGLWASPAADAQRSD